ncbi:aquaporin-like protein [Entomophthora muscae]|uniref:Aquaporin-like protein n=1 Tax=Entomophthora muscae TaxID=34485 RepID=A0ACC2SNN3_9FUNG|nr:aquaporin-like protein [Entomophthora muscae]
MSHESEFHINVEPDSDGSLLHHPKGSGLREYIGEFIGSLVLVLLGDGVIAQVTFNENSEGTKFLSINLGWAMALAFSILLAGPTCHLNPAVTLGFAAIGKHPWAKVPGYIAAQLAGAFFGAFSLFMVYFPAFFSYPGGARTLKTAGIFATFPFEGSPLYTSFMTEMLATSLLMMGLLALGKHNMPSYFGALWVGLLVGSIGISLGAMTGYALNPARDLGPRLFTLAAGWGTAPFTAADDYFWVPILGPIFGAVGAALVSQILP